MLLLWLSLLLDIGSEEEGAWEWEEEWMSNVSDAVVVVVGVVRRRDSRGRSLGLGQQWHTPFCCSQGR